MTSQNQNLHDALRGLAGETGRASAPDRVRLALRAELRARARRRRFAAWWPAAAAAALVLGLWLGWPRPGSGPAPDPAPEVVDALPPAAAEPAAPAPAVLPESAPLQPAPRARFATASAPTARAAVTPWFFYAGLPPAERGQVVRIRASSATAAQFGIYRGTDTVPAQVFIGDDGLARAIRFVR